jgi:hypothetical protein
MPNTAAYLTFEFTDNPSNLPTNYIADVIIDPPEPMPSPWVNCTFQEYETLIALQKDEIHSAADVLNYSKFQNSEIEKAFTLAWIEIFKYFDQAGLIQLVAWLFDPAVPQEAKDLIFAVNLWKDAIMFEYLMNKKVSILYGYPYDFDYGFIGPPPCRFTDIFLAARPQYKPVGYTVPDVSNYTPGTRENPWNP